MKKIVSLFLVFALVLVGLSAKDEFISPMDLPESAQSLLSTAFPGVEVQQVQRIFHNYKVDLGDDTVVNFDKDGQWESITNRYGLPVEAVPDRIFSIVTSTYPLLDVVRLEKDFGRIEVTLSDGEELLFSMEGNALGRKTDSDD